MSKDEKNIELENTTIPVDQDQPTQAAMTRGDFLKLAGAGGARDGGHDGHVRPGHGRKGQERHISFRRQRRFLGLAQGHAGLAAGRT